MAGSRCYCTLAERIYYQPDRRPRLGDIGLSTANFLSRKHTVRGAPWCIGVRRYTPVRTFWWLYTVVLRTTAIASYVCQSVFRRTIRFHRYCSFHSSVTMAVYYYDVSTMPTQLVTLKKNLYFELDLCNLPELCGRNHVIDLWATCVQK